MKNHPTFFDFAAEVGLTKHLGGVQATETLTELCHIGEGKYVLDVGCGVGVTPCYIAKRFGCRVVGVDISERMVERSKERAKEENIANKVEFRVADAQDLPFEDAVFDAVITESVASFPEDKQKAVKEYVRVTKPGGYVGWLELSWKKQPTREFLYGVSNVICAYCMLKVETFENWKKLFSESGVKELQTLSYSQEFHGLRGMLGDEGLANACRIMIKYLTDSSVRKRMKTIEKFFKEHDDYFGYGIYVGKK